jgi:hypothetical protein
MIMSVVAIGIVALLAWLWSTRGFYSGLINLICTVVAGAIAFGLHETVAYALLASAPASGFFSFLENAAWAIALAGTFAVSLAILRGITEALLRANVKLNDLVNIVGGGVTGLLSGIIVSGITVLSLGFLRVDSDFLGYQNVQVTPSGSLERSGGLWVPTDSWTAGLYSHMSGAALASATPLRELHPHFADQASALRISFGRGKARNTLRPDQAEVKKYYTVGADGKVPVADLLNDSLAKALGQGAQKFTTLEGEQPAQGSRIDGFVINFKSAAKEKSGRVVIGQAHLRLVGESADGTPLAIHPLALISQADASAPISGRWRFDDGQGLFIGSVGGGAEWPVAAEFVVPQGFVPRAIYIRNVRYAVPEKPVTYATVEARDMAIASGALTAAGGASIDLASLDESRATTVRGNNNGYTGVNLGRQLGFVLQDGMQGGLEINENRNIIDGVQSFDPKAVRGNRGIDRQLAIERFALTEDTAIVQVDVSLSVGNELSLLGPAAQAALSESSATSAPMLIDANGQAYRAVGYVFEDTNELKIRFTPSRTIASLDELSSDLVMLSRSAPDKKLTLVFRVSRGVRIDRFTIGTHVVAIYRPSIQIDANQQR